jgi:hypothetical protein
LTRVARKQVGASADGAGAPCNATDLLAALRAEAHLAARLLEDVDGGAWATIRRAWLNATMMASSMVELGFGPTLRQQRALRGVLSAARAAEIEATLAPRPAGVCAATVVSDRYRAPLWAVLAPPILAIRTPRNCSTTVNPYGKYLLGQDDIPGARIARVGACAAGGLGPLGTALGGPGGPARRRPQPLREGPRRRLLVPLREAPPSGGRTVLL